jgi:hypothetical protein
MCKRLKPIPRFTGESDQLAFWESCKNDSAEYVDSTKAKLATFAELRPST